MVGSVFPQFGAGWRRTAPLPVVVSIALRANAGQRDLPAWMSSRRGDGIEADDYRPVSHLGRFVGKIRKLRCTVTRVCEWAPRCHQPSPVDCAPARPKGLAPAKRKLFHALVDDIVLAWARGAAARRRPGSPAVVRPPTRDRPAPGASGRGSRRGARPAPEIFRSSRPALRRREGDFQLLETYRKHRSRSGKISVKLPWAVCVLPHVMPGDPNPDKVSRRKVQLRGASGCLVSMSVANL